LSSSSFFGIHVRSPFSTFPSQAHNDLEHPNNGGAGMLGTPANGLTGACPPPS
jgi:hypothetical protein